MVETMAAGLGASENRVRLRKMLFGVVFCGACGSEGPASLDPGSTLDLTLVERIPIGSGTDGIAVSPDGESIALASSHQGFLMIVDSDTFRADSTRGAPNSRGVSFSSDGSSVGIASRFGFTIVALEQPATETHLDSPAVFAIPDASGSGFIISGDRSGTLRLSADGSVMAQNPLVTGAIAVNAGAIFAADRFEARIAVMEAISLEVLRTVEIPFRAETIIPLADGEEVLILSSQFAAAPLRTAVINTVSNESRDEHVLTETIDNRGGLGGIDGNPWVAISSSLALVATRFGLLVVDTGTGRIARQMNEPSDFGLSLVPCCVLAFDEHRQRLLIVSRVDNEMMVFSVRDG